MSEPRLTLADQVLVNMMGALHLTVHRDPARDKMRIDVLREVLPQANREHPRLRPIIEAAEMFFTVPTVDLPRDQTALMLGREAVVTFFEWRSGVALDAWREAGGQGSTGKGQA